MKLRGYLTVGVLGGGLVVADPVQRVLIAPLIRALPSRRTAILSRWQRLLAHFVIGSTRIVGGARIPPPPALPGQAGVLVLMNHQSLLDIPLVVAALRPAHPLIITRARYARGKPLISYMVRLYQYPLVEPRATVRNDLQKLAEAARTSSVPVVLFPEGTRTRNGELGPWREWGLRAILSARRWMVHLLISDGFWTSARLTDFLSGVSAIDGRIVAKGPFEGPPPGSDPELFIAEMRERMDAALAELRSGALAR